MTKKDKLYWSILIGYATIINVAYVLLDANGLPFISQIAFGIAYHFGFNSIYSQYAKEQQE